MAITNEQRQESERDGHRERERVRERETASDDGEIQNDMNLIVFHLND